MARVLRSVICCVAPPHKNRKTEEQLTTEAADNSKASNKKMEEHHVTGVTDNSNANGVDINKELCSKEKSEPAEKQPGNSEMISEKQTENVLNATTEMTRFSRVEQTSHSNHTQSPESSQRAWCQETFTAELSKNHRLADRFENLVSKLERLEAVTQGPLHLTDTDLNRTKKAVPCCQFIEPTNSWSLNNISGEDKLTLDNVQPDQNVDIRRCDGVVVHINNSCDLCCLENSCGVSLIINDVRVIRVKDCRQIQIQVDKGVKQIDLQSTDGCQLYLSQNCCHTPVTVFKCSEVNISVPDDAGEYLEHAVVAQLCSRWDGERLLTTAYVS